MRSLLLLLCFAVPALAVEKVQGEMRLERREGSFLLAAPHGGFDIGTDAVVDEAATALHWSSLVAKGYRKWAHPINVNRPTEGIRLSPAEEKHTPVAEAVYAVYKEKVLSVAPTFYVEVHGESSSDDVEVATVGVSEAEASRLKKIFVRAARPSKHGVKVEGVDKLSFTAGAAKKFGILGEMKRALHVELPKSLREGDPSAAAALLEKALPEAAALLR